MLGRMAPALSISPRTGALAISDPAVLLTPGLSKAEAQRLLRPYASDGLDHRNGYEWLNFQGLTFGGRPCFLSLCFFQGRLREASWSAGLPEAETEGGWPSRAEIDEEVSFVRGELARQLGRAIPANGARFRWGEVWSLFDLKGSQAANGLRYATTFGHTLQGLIAIFKRAEQ
jgi:hypothetical protein